MRTIKHIVLFIKNNFMQLQRKYYILPLLLLFPMAIIAMLAFITITFFSPKDQAIIDVGLVDLDQTEETKMVMSLMKDSEEFTNFIAVEEMDEKTANERIDQNDLTAYIIFPEHFADLLFKGKNINLEIVGNDTQRTESLLVKSFMNSIATHINSAQASILAIDDYIGELNIDAKERREILMEQFQSFLLFTLTKDEVISEDIVRNSASETPLHYYIIASWMMISTIWLFIFYNFLQTEASERIQRRMRLYSVTLFQQLFAKAFVSIFMTALFSAGFFAATKVILEYNLSTEDYMRFAGITLLYFMSFIFILLILELLIHSQKLLLVVQSIFTFLIVAISGAIVPTIYFPSYMQDFVEFSFSYAFFDQLKDLLLNGDTIYNFNLLGITTLVSFILVLLLAYWKERVQS